MAEELPKVEHLVLLVGGNPLPNAVAGILLAAEGATVTLVQSAKTLHSPGTGPIAQQLKGWLANRRPSLMIECKEVDESNPAAIWRGVCEQLEAVGRPRVGLNYTGGTKAMAVHAYRAAIEHWTKEKGVEPCFSYLDARALRMVLHPAAPTSASEVRRPYVALSVPMKLEEDLMRLHGWKLQNSMRRTAILPNTALAIARTHADTKKTIAWKEWKQRVLYGARKKPRQPVPLPREKGLEAVADALAAELPLDGKGRLAPTALKDQGSDVYLWLDGLWLESATFEAMRACTSSCRINEVTMNVKPTLGREAAEEAGEEAEDDDEGEFEFDVAAMRGFQLFGLTCAIQSKKPKLKLKLFEAHIRSRQLGGDEARAALVCTSESPEQLELDVHRAIDPEGRTRVFGRQHLADLATHLEEWISEQCGEE